MRPGRSKGRGAGGTGASVAAAMLAVALPARADTAFDMQVWTAAFVTARLSGREPAATSGLSGWLDLHARRGGAGVVGIIRPALGYRFDKVSSVWAGFASVGSFDDDPAKSTQEHRAWQQGLFTLPVGRLMVQVRPRFEQRVREDHGDVALRARVFARANVTFEEGSPFWLATWDEPFFHLNDAAWGPRAGFDQNRLFLGFGVRGPGTARVEVGYVNVTVLRPTGLLIGHNLGINLFVDL